MIKAGDGPAKGKSTQVRPGSSRYPDGIREGHSKRCPNLRQCPLLPTFVGLVVPRLVWAQCSARAKGGPMCVSPSILVLLML